MNGNRDITKRLEALESVHKIEPLIVLARYADGQEIRLPMKDFLQSKDNLEFIKIVDGTDLGDLDLFLKAIDEEARLGAEA